MPIKYLYIAIFLFTIKVATAQQDPQFTHIILYQNAVNPAASAVNAGINLNVGVRWQWVGLQGSPVSQVITASSPLSFFNSHIGLVLMNDIAGAHRATQIGVQYNTSKKWNRISTAVGLQLGMIQYMLNQNELITPSGNYSNGINHNDPSLSNSKANNLKPDAGLGLSIFNSDWQLDLSIQHLLSPALKLKSGAVPAIINYRSTLYLNFKYKYDVNSNIMLQPMATIKSDFIKNTAELQVLARYKENYWFGVGCRGYSKNTIDAAEIILGYNIKPSLLLYYSYDATLQKLNKVSTGSHELSLHYKVEPQKSYKRGKIIYSPRFL